MKVAVDITISYPEPSLSGGSGYEIVDIIKVNKFSQTMFSWDMPKWAYDNMRIE